MTQRLRNVVFTVNNYTDDDVIKARSAIEDGTATYLVFGYEIGKEGTPHLQGYIELSKQLRMASLKPYLPRAHMESRRGTAQQATDYCKKDGKYEEWGSMKNPGKRNDLAVVKQMVKDKKKMYDIALESTSMQSIRHAQVILQHQPLSRTRQIPEVIWVYGQTGVGKTQYANDHLIGDDFWRANSTLKWFDGYDRNSDVLVNEFRGDFCPLHTLLELLDGYELRVPIKGGFTTWYPTRVVFTTIYKPYECYRTDDEPLEQLYRRITLFLLVESVDSVRSMTANEAWRQR